MENLIELIELDASSADSIEAEKSGEPADATEKPTSQDHGFRETKTRQNYNVNDQPGLEDVDFYKIRTDTPEIVETIKVDPSPKSVTLPRLPQLPDVALIDSEDPIAVPLKEIRDDSSIASSAMPSIFGHSSSLTSATVGSLPGITEEDVQARNSSTQFQSKKPSMPLNESPSLSNVPLFDIDKPDEQGFPWLVQAAREGNEEIVRKLLVSNADIKAFHTVTKRDALAEASLAGHQSIVALLLEEGSLVESVDAESNTALHYACRNGHLAVSKSLLACAKSQNKDGALVNASGPEKKTALHLAIEAPYRNVAMLLIQYRANVNARDAFSRTPLHVAAAQGNVAMCSYLLNEGAQLDSREGTSFGNTAFPYSAI